MSDCKGCRHALQRERAGEAEEVLERRARVALVPSAEGGDEPGGCVELVTSMTGIEIKSLGLAKFGLLCFTIYATVASLVASTAAGSER